MHMFYSTSFLCPILYKNINVKKLDPAFSALCDRLILHLTLQTVRCAKYSEMLISQLQRRLKTCNL